MRDVPVVVWVAVVGAASAIVTTWIAQRITYLLGSRKLEVTDEESLRKALMAERADLVREAHELAVRIMKLQEEVIALNKKAIAIERDCLACQNKHLKEVAELSKRILELGGSL
jgi:uncharacterized protein YlxW (UPF0749 family)